MKRPRTFFAAIVLAIAVPGTAAAHARLESSDPARRAKLDRPPDSIRLRFNEAIEADYSKLSVENAKGESVASGARVSPEDAQVLILELPKLPPGSYTVRFEVLSVDGHRIKQSYPFTVETR